MPKPKSAQVLELQGSFKGKPSRVRQDVEGSDTPFSLACPEHFKDCEEEWDYMVARLPKVAFTGADDSVIGTAARLFKRFKLIKDTDRDFLRVTKQFVEVLDLLGMTPMARIRMGKIQSEGKAKNRFARLKKAG